MTHPSTALPPPASPAASAPSAPADPAPPSGGPSGSLAKGQIGTFDLVFFVVAAAAPLTVLAGVAPFAIGIGGPGTPLGYLVSGALLVLFAAGFTAMSRYVRNAGAFCTGVLGWLRVTLSAKVLGVALVLEVLVLLVMDVGVLADRGTAALDITSFDPSVLSSSGGMAGMFVLVIGAFTGFEATAIYAEEARDPERTVPRATFIAIGFLALFYAAGVWILMGGFGTDRSVSMARSSDGPQLTFHAADRFVGPWLADSMHVLIVVSAFAATLAFHNAAARYLYALGREGLLPRPSWAGSRPGRVHR